VLGLESLRTRQDPRRETTSVALVEAAESLFAAHGVNGVSTRQLGAAIGSSNTNVVAYYFGSKEALVEAVYLHRLPAIDRRRGELLRAVDESGQGNDLLALLHAFALPLLEQTDAQGRHSYARFVAGIERSGWIASRGRVENKFPETSRLVQRISAHIPAASAADANTRIRLATALIFTALQIADQDNEAEAASVHLFDTALTMAAAALAAPASTIAST
jgi:AcrR family transcriptional regulator